MTQPVDRILRLLFPLILGAFLCLYALSILSGMAAEASLLTASVASIALAIIGRAAIGILDAAAKARPADSSLEALRDHVFGTDTSALGFAHGVDGELSDALATSVQTDPAVTPANKVGAYSQVTEP